MFILTVHKNDKSEWKGSIVPLSFTCRTVSVYYLSLLRRYSSAISSGSTYQCSTCGIREYFFPRLKKLSVHISIHEETITQSLLVAVKEHTVLGRKQ